jgi:hypothetical protein
MRKLSKRDDHSSGTTLLCAALVLGFFSISTLGQQALDPFEFADSSELKLKGTASQVQVFNNTTRELTLNIKVANKESKNSQQLSEVLQVEPIVLRLPAAAVGSITVRIKPQASFKDGSYSAFLIASEAPSGTVRRKIIRLDVTSVDDGVKITSLPNSWKGLVFYDPLFGNGVATLRESLPLSSEFKTKDILITGARTNLGGEADGKLKEGEAVALLVGELGASALLRLKGVNERLASGTSGLVLDFISDGPPDKYSGSTIQLKNAEGKAVELSVTSTHVWYYPALVIAIGILFYYAMQRYFNVRRKVWGLDEQEAQLEMDYAAAQSSFAASVLGKPYAADSIEDNFFKKSAEVRKNIKTLKWENFITFDEKNSRYQEIVATLDALSAVIKQWNLFGTRKLSPLNGLLDSIDLTSIARPDDPSIKTEPAVFTDAKALLVPRQIALNDLSDFSKRLDDARAKVTPWVELNSLAAKLWNSLDRIIKAPNFSEQDDLTQDEIKENSRKVLVAWHHLWEDKDYNPETEAQTLREVKDALLGYSKEPSAAIEHLMTIGELTTISDVDRDTDVGLVPTDETESPATRIKQIQIWRFEWDFFYVLMALGIAVFTGLKELYFDQSFGTLRDYLTAFFWGIGAKALLDAVTNVITRFWPRPA